MCLISTQDLKRNYDVSKYFFNYEGFNFNRTLAKENLSLQTSKYFNLKLIKGIDFNRTLAKDNLSLQTS